MQNSQNICQSADQDFLLAIEAIYRPCKLTSTLPVPEPESTEYAASSFILDGLKVQYRSAKITPAKTGQFVTLWNRSSAGPIQPYDISDPVDLFIISTRDGQNFGQFIFPKSILYDKGVLSGKGKAGKRAIRVYPPWAKATNQQAKRSQQWQLKFFIEIQPGQSPDLSLAKKLLISGRDSQSV